MLDELPTFVYVRYQILSTFSGLLLWFNITPLNFPQEVAQSQPENKWSFSNKLWIKYKAYIAMYALYLIHNLLEKTFEITF